MNGEGKVSEKMESGCSEGRLVPMQKQGLDRPAPALVARARQGDLEAFGELFRQTHTRIYNFVRSKGLNPEDAADATQRVFVSAWKGLRALRSDEAFLVWLHRIALNAVRDTRRPVELPLGTLETGDCDEEMAYAVALDEVARPDTAVLSQDLQAAVREAVRSLPDHFRVVVTMHHLEELEVEEIAKALDVPAGTVLSRLARGREALRCKLNRWLKE